MKEQKHSIEVIFTMVTFLMYAMALLMFVSLGATVYRSVTQQMELHQTQRTAENYLREKVRQNDRAGDVSIGEIEGVPALQISQTVGGKEYVTYIFTEGGSLKELLVSAEKKAKMSDGTVLLSMEAVSFTEEQGCLTVTLQLDDNHSHTFQIRRRSSSL